MDPFGETTAHQIVQMYSRNAQGGKASKKPFHGGISAM
jgi:hypothetical protein